MITGLYAGILAAMLAVLILRVALRRLKYRVGLGDGGIGDLGQAIRVHGNFVETVPIMLILLGLMELNHNPVWLLHGFGSLLILTRLMHAYGITSSPLHSFGRKWSVLGSLLLLILGCITLLMNYVND